MRTLQHQQTETALLFQHSKWEIHQLLFISVNNRGAWTSFFFLDILMCPCFAKLFSIPTIKRSSRHKELNIIEIPKIFTFVAKWKLKPRDYECSISRMSPPWIGRVLHHFPHFAIHLLTGCNEMHPGHLEEMHTPPPTTTGTPNDWTVFILNLQRCKCSKMMLLKKTWTNKRCNFSAFS